MKVVIVGAGALGSLYAAYLARDGHDVSLVARGERALALAMHGIPVTGADDFTARCDIVTEPQRLRSSDLLILATKTYDTAGALQSLRELKVRSAFSVQNGVQKNEALVQAFGPATVLGAISMMGGEVLAAQGDEPGAVRYTRAGMTTIGEIARISSARLASHSGRMGRCNPIVLFMDCLLREGGSDPAFSSEGWASKGFPGPMVFSTRRACASRPSRRCRCRAPVWSEARCSRPSAAGTTRP